MDIQTIGATCTIRIYSSGGPHWITGEGADITITIPNAFRADQAPADALREMIAAGLPGAIAAAVDSFEKALREHDQAKRAKAEEAATAAMAAPPEPPPSAPLD